MNLIEERQLIDFFKILLRNNMLSSDFSLVELDTTDPKTDEVLALQGILTVQRTSTYRSRQYAIGDGTEWVHHFERDLNSGAYS